MEEFDFEDFSTSEEDEDYVPSGGEYSEDDVNELVKEDEVDGEEQTQNTKGKKRKAQSIPARKRKQSGLLLEEEEDAMAESGGSSSEEEDETEEQEKGIGSEDARKKKEDELWASFLNDVGPKPKLASSTQAKKGEEAEKMNSNKLLVKTEELEKPKETEKVKIAKVFDFAGEEVRVTKEVDATSKEAKSFFKQNEKEKPQANVPSAVPSLPAGSGLQTSLEVGSHGGLPWSMGFHGMRPGFVLLLPWPWAESARQAGIRLKRCPCMMTLEWRPVTQKQKAGPKISNFYSLNFRCEEEVLEDDDIMLADDPRIHKATAWNSLIDYHNIPITRQKAMSNVLLKPPAGPGLGVGSVRKSSHWVACSKKLAVGQACHRREQGCLGKSLAILPWSQKPPAGQSLLLGPGLGDGSVRKSSHWAARSKKLAVG
ncbi:Craniofacial development protein 1 [Sciurus carolinensis]|uniref:Craniofacial development protein 1 n=1 Tax=Sciurus carolinensis TaxID=30640 RepID=A0AA41NCY1_SCICA|nr:Craniofacial development protein 1 [Sciurus carolinensis]